MASGRELSYVLLFGILSSYACSFVILAHPGFTICIMLRLGLGLTLCVCYSAIFTKTNRIYRIFHGCMKGNQKPAYISSKSQLVICFGLINIQVLPGIAWLFIEPPSVQVIHPSRKSAVLTCGVSTNSLMMSLAYNGILVFLCTWYAFKTRKIPENFNEAKYIGFTMYSTCIIWLAFIPIFFGSKNDYEIQMSSLCMCVILSATVTLCCLFMPKMWIVLLHPEKYARCSPGEKKNKQATGQIIGGGAGGQARTSISGPTAATAGASTTTGSKLRFAKTSRDSSLSNLSETAKTPLTPKTPPGGGITELRESPTQPQHQATSISVQPPSISVSVIQPPMPSSSSCEYTSSSAASVTANHIQGGTLQAGAGVLKKQQPQPQQQQQQLSVTRSGSRVSFSEPKQVYSTKIDIGEEDEEDYEDEDGPDGTYSPEESSDCARYPCCQQNQQQQQQQQQQHMNGVVSTSVQLHEEPPLKITTASQATLGDEEESSKEIQGEDESSESKEDSFSNNKDVSVSVSEGSSVRKGPPLLGIDIYEEDEKGGSWLYETRL